MQYEIKEDGRNGTVEVDGTMIVRTSRKVIGGDDVQRIPLSKVTGVEVDKQLVKSDILTLKVGSETFTWKMPEAEAFADAVLKAIG